MAKVQGSTRPRRHRADKQQQLLVAQDDFFAGIHGEEMLGGQRPAAEPILRGILEGEFAFATRDAKRV